MQLHHWVREEYLPRARRALGWPLQVAILVVSDVQSGRGRLRYPATEELHPGIGCLGWFAEETMALLWLAQQRLRWQSPYPPRESFISAK